MLLSVILIHIFLTARDGLLDTGRRGNFAFDEQNSIEALKRKMKKAKSLGCF